MRRRLIKERAGGQVRGTRGERRCAVPAGQNALPETRRNGYREHVNAVRPPAVAGLFYPSDPRELAGAVDAMLAAAAPGAPGPCPKAIIVPHAGYIYSGPIAASAFARVAPYGARIERVVLIGPAHRMFVDGLATPGAARLATPLGELDVAPEARELAANPAAHAKEHALEVILPFVQRTCPRARVVPVIGSRGTPAEVGELLERYWGGPETLIVISSDLSHYEPYDIGRRLDTRTAERIVALDPTLAGEDACGALGIAGLLWLAQRRGARVELLDLRSSGDTAGDRARVVGYGAFACYEAPAS
jgi:AmmeMemoRadiSam system protein B